MQLALPYSEMLSRHPLQVQEVMDKLSKSKSMDKDMNPENYIWEYFWGISIMSIDMVSLLKTGVSSTDNRSIEERIVGLEVRATKGTKGKKWARCKTLLMDIPKEVLDYHR